MKTVLEVSNIGSAFTYKPDYMGLAVYKTLDKGQYGIKAKNVTLENRRTREQVKLGDTTPISSKELFEYRMVVPRERLENTLPGMIGTFFNTIGWDRKNEWIVKFKEV